MPWAIGRWSCATGRFGVGYPNGLPYLGDRMMQPFTRLDLLSFRALTSWATLALLMAAIIVMSAR